MALTGANVAFGKAIAAEVPVYLFVLFRFAVASPRWPRWRAASRARAPQHDRRAVARSGADGAARHGRLHGAHARGPEAHGRGRCRHHHGHPAGGGGGARRGVRGRPALAPAVLAVALAVAGLVLVQATGAGGGRATLVGNLLVGGAVLCEASFVMLGKRLAPPYRPLRLALGANLAGWCWRCRWRCSTLPAFDARTVTIEHVAARHLVRALGQRPLPVAVVPRPAARRDLAGRPRHRGHPGCGARRSALYLGEAIGGWRLAGAALVIAGIVLGALAIGVRPLVEAIEIWPLARPRGPTPARTSSGYEPMPWPEPVTLRSIASRWSRWGTAAR